MDNSKMLILGGGALGVAALGYLGLQFMDDDKEELPELVFSKKEQLNKKIKITQEDSVEKEVKEEIENVKIVEPPKDSELYNSIEKSEETCEEKVTGWGQFWKSTYDENKNKKEVEASDFN